VVVLVVIQVPHKMAEQQLLGKALMAAKETRQRKAAAAAAAVRLLLVLMGLLQWAVQVVQV
jgi:hypothetical protein